MVLVLGAGYLGIVFFDKTAYNLIRQIVVMLSG